jgi:ribosomal protein S18 acetylase RimI-like enzyme
MINVRNALETDNLSEIAQIIYYTDPWVYPAFFDNNVEIAKKVLPVMMRKDTIFQLKNVVVATIHDQIVGSMILMEKYPQANYNEMKSSFLESWKELTPRFEEVMTGYFNTVDFDFTGIQIVSLAVHPDHKRKGIASALLSSLHPSKTYSLAYVKRNTPAKLLYEKFGFTFQFEYPGFLGIPCVEVVKNGAN